MLLVTKVARPDYVNVFLGQNWCLYHKQQAWGWVQGAGEKGVISSQNWVTGLSAGESMADETDSAVYGAYQLDLLPA